MIGFLLLLLIAALIGGLGQLLSGYSAGGLLVSIVVGLIGALLGMWLAQTLSLPELFVITVDGQAIPFIWSVVGAALFTALLGLLARPRRA